MQTSKSVNSVFFSQSMSKEDFFKQKQAARQALLEREQADATPQDKPLETPASIEDATPSIAVEVQEVEITPSIEVPSVDTLDEVEDVVISQKETESTPCKAQQDTDEDISIKEEKSLQKLAVKDDTQDVLSCVTEHLNKDALVSFVEKRPIDEFVASLATQIENADANDYEEVELTPYTMLAALKVVQAENDVMRNYVVCLTHLIEKMNAKLSRAEVPEMVFHPQELQVTLPSDLIEVVQKCPEQEVRLDSLEMRQKYLIDANKRLEAQIEDLLKLNEANSFASADATNNMLANDIEQAYQMMEKPEESDFIKDSSPVAYEIPDTKPKTSKAKIALYLTLLLLGISSIFAVIFKVWLYLPLFK